jgi:hypothetical protein
VMPRRTGTSTSETSRSGTQSSGRNISRPASLPVLPATAGRRDQGRARTEPRRGRGADVGAGTRRSPVCRRRSCGDVDQATRPAIASPSLERRPVQVSAFEPAPAERAAHRDSALTATAISAPRRRVQPARGRRPSHGAGAEGGLGRVDGRRREPGRRDSLGSDRVARLLAHEARGR